MEHTLQSSQFTSPSAAPSIADATDALLQEHQRRIWKSTDRLMCWLMHFEWLLGITLAVWRTPFTWEGSTRYIHPHVWAAIFLGYAITCGPALMAIWFPGRVATRHVVAIGQMMMSGLLIDLGGGQIEMHFQIFGTLAFLAFYRDWRVVVTASAVTALDHITRGFLLPQSIYGVSYASGWITVEHIAWVLFEDAFLVVACVRGVREMRGIAISRALLERSHHDIEQKVLERTAELRSAQNELMKSARGAGMAEIATSVLHNVGNVLNSVNVSAGIVADKVRTSEVSSLARVSELIATHHGDLPAFLTQDDRGKLIPSFIADLAECLGDEQTIVLREVENLSHGIEHIKQIVAAQQTMAKSSTIRTAVRPATLFDNALGIETAGAPARFKVHKRFAEISEIMLDQHKVLQILINLITNASQAVASRPIGEREVTLSLQIARTEAGDRLQFQVADNGMGISPENINRIFTHGFSTKKNGHGFGLHGAVNAAREMDGSLSVQSDGEGKGAVFTLALPITAPGDDLSQQSESSARSQISCIQ